MTEKTAVHNSGMATKPIHIIWVSLHGVIGEQEATSTGIVTEVRSRWTTETSHPALARGSA